jgi:hypothetical protein
VPLPSAYCESEPAAISVRHVAPPIEIFPPVICALLVVMPLELMTVEFPPPVIVTLPPVMVAPDR